MKLDPTSFPQAAHKALEDARLKIALGRLKTHFVQKRADAIAQYDDFETLREAGAAIRSSALSRLDTLLETFERNVTARGGHVHWARDAEEARKIVLDILRKAGAKTVTKGKSMVTEEIGLNDYLEHNSIKPIETDLGEYIIQLRREPPSHIIAPAFHLNKEDVAEIFRASHTELSASRPLSERSALVAEARAMLRKKFEAADAGITGANFLAAAEGAAVIVTNEGNGDLTRLLPRTHIVVTGLEKIVADMNEVSVLLRLLTRSATGQEISSYVSVMGGPGDEEGASRAFHVVLLDNGRTSLLTAETAEVLRCIRCAACLNHCPVYNSIGGHAYGATYPGPIGAALNPGIIGLAQAHHHPNASTFCGRCVEVCPVKIPLTSLMRHWRAVEFETGKAPKATILGLKLWSFAARRPHLYHLASRLLARLMKTSGDEDFLLRWFLPFQGWFSVRDLPAPAGKTFFELWRKQ